MLKKIIDITQAEIFANTLKKKKKSPSVFFSSLFTVYKKVAKFSLTQQKIFWVLVFGIMYLVLVYPMTRSLVNFLTIFIGSVCRNIDVY